MKTIVCIILLFCGFMWHCTAADSLQTNVHNIETGLPSNHVYCVVRDRNGYTWFLTDNGIVKYNGYSYKLFNTSNGLPSNDVWYLSEDSYGRLWVYTHAYEVGYIKDDIYHKIDLDTKNSFVQIMKHVESNGYSYLTVSGVFAGRFIVVDSAGKTKSFPSKNRVLTYGGPENIFIVNNQFKESLTFKPGKYGLQLVAKCNAVFRSQFSVMCGPIPPTYNAVGYYHGGSDLMLVNAITCAYRPGNLKDYGAAMYEANYIAYAINDQFCFITDRNIYFVDQNYNLVSRFYYPDLFKKLVQVTYYYNDPHRIKWYTTKTEGCLQVFPEERGLHNAAIFTDSDVKNFRLVGRFSDGRSWWFDDMTLTLVEVSKELEIKSRISFPEKIVYVAQSSGEKIYTVSTNSIKIFDLASKQPMPLIDVGKPVYVKRLYNYDYSIWLKKNDAGEEELNDESKKAITKHFSLLHQYKPGLLFGLTPYGFKRISLLSDHSRVETLDGGKFVGMQFDPYHSKYWLYNKGRVLIYDPETGAQAELTKDVLTLLNIQTIADIKVDSFYNIYVQSPDGIRVFHPFKNTVRRIGLNANLTDCKIELWGKKIVVAGKFGVAHATAYGPLKIGKFNIVLNIKARHYNRLYDLLVPDEQNVMLATDKGHFTMRLYGSNSNTASYPDSNVQRLVLSAPFQQSLVNQDTIRLSPGTDNLNLDYINYYGKGERTYTYRIVGKTNWQKTGSGEIFLTNLDAEKFYKIECSVNDEILISRPYTFYIYKSPYWYQSSGWKNLFWTGGILMFAAFTLTVILVTRKIAARASKRKQAMVDLELRAIYSQINPHFIFNTLSSALYFISKKDFDGAYSNVSKFSRLLRAYLKSSRNRYTLLSEEIDMLKNYIELQKDRFEQKFDYAIEIDNKLPVDNIQIPSLLLQPLVENAISHGLFHMQKGGFLLLKFEQGKNSNELVCHVEDNGIGREKAKEINRESSAKQSYGTTLTLELVELFQRYEQMNIQIEYTDKKLPHTGTIVKLFIRNLKFIA